MNREIYTKRCEILNKYPKPELLSFNDLLKRNVNSMVDGFDWTNEFTRMCEKTGCVIDCGFFYIANKENASYLSGPFFDNYGFIEIRDFSKEALKNTVDVIKENFDYYIQSPEQYGRSKITLKNHLYLPTKQNPIVVCLRGNDDFSWTKNFDTMQNAQICIHLLIEECSNRNSEESLYNNINDRYDGWIFTN